MTASLPMYDSASTRTANDRFWQAIRHDLGRGPESLDRTTDPHNMWTAPDLLFSQTCGLPFRTSLYDRVTLIGTPDYGVRGCPPGYYKSCVVVRRDDPRKHLSEFEGARLARNDMRSQSGWAAIEQELIDRSLGFSFAGTVIDTGSHRCSAQAVTDTRADIASIDAVTWTFLKRETSAAQHLRVLTNTRPTPGLPYITSRSENAKPLFDAITRAIERLSARDRARLLLKGLVAIRAETYLAIAVPKA